MYVVNSAVGLNQDDTDMTIINHSLLYDGNDEPISSCIPIVRRNQTKSVDDSNDKHDYVYVNHHLLETVKQIEQILNYYRQDLKQESNTQLNCNRQLITRLVDLIRPIYSSNEQQMKDLDILYEDISILHEKRFLEQKEKNDQLYNKIRHLKKSIISTPIEDDDRDSLMTNIYRMNSMFNYEEWVEMEEETKKLYDLVNRQREQIDKLIELLTQTETANDVLAINSLHLPTKVSKNCSVCDSEFPITYNETQVIDHVENCLTTSDIIDSNISMEIKELECPYCNEKLPSNNDLLYMQHLSQCFNEMTAIFR